MATPTYDLLDSVTIGTSTASVTFSSIDQTYRDLILVADVKLNGIGVAGVEIGPNGATTNLSAVQAYGDGSTAVSNTRTAIEFLADQLGRNAIVQIMDYSATDKHKTFLIRSNATLYAHMAAARWASTSAITSLVIGDTGGRTLEAGSTLYLYGISA